MNEDIETVYIGESSDIDQGSVENFEYEDNDYAIFHLPSGFFATQGHCYCEESAFLSEGTIDGEELECASCGRVFSIVSGDSLSNQEDGSALKIFDITEEEGKIYLIL